MISLKTISRYIGMLIILESMLLLSCFVVALYYKESQTITFAIITLLTFLVGCTMHYTCLSGRKEPNRRESYFIVAIVWIVFSIIGMVPFLLSGYCDSVATAFFEAMSGFTTTGATALNNIDSLPHSLLFWRSITHWIGGLGIVFFTITLLPNNLQGGTQLYAAEKVGLSSEKIHPRAGTTAKWLWMLYTFLTMACALSLWCCGMTLFDSVNFAMSTMATGGFAPRGNGVLYYNSVTIDVVLVIYMVIAGLNFTLLYLCFFKRKIKGLFKNEELRFFLLFIIIASGLSATSLVVYNNYPVWHAIRTAVFNIVSLQTTTGFVTDEYALWYPPLWTFLLVCNIFGACSGSTTGGVKCIRIMLVLKIAKSQFTRLLHPNAVIPVRINKSPVYEATENVLLSYFFLFVFFIISGSILFQIMGLPMLDSTNLAITCVANIGPVSGHWFSSYDSLNALPDAVKWLCSFLMLAGRLEIFCVILPLTHVFWKKD